MAEQPSFDEQMAKERTGVPVSYANDSYSAASDKTVISDLPNLTDAELDRLPVLKTGAQLSQGSVYYDLNDRAKGPFKAIGGQHAGADERLIAKSEVDYLLWNRIVGEDAQPEIERPEEAR
jgi:hypothetical protein